MGKTRLALCGNVFPAETPAAVLCAVEGPVADWVRELERHGHGGPCGFGLYLPAAAARELWKSEEETARLGRALARARVEVWTANAFPMGGFHGPRVKERAFLPDWRQPERLGHTLRVADVLARLMEPGAAGSLSTCPLGYGPEARSDPAAAENLRRAQEHLLLLQQRTGVRLLLALEPEPDGAFERAGDLAAWLLEHVHQDVAAAERRVGLCWDLCHSAVVAERADDVLAVLRASEVPLGKVQVSAALCLPGQPAEGDLEWLRRLAGDPYLHQVRGNLRDGRPCRFPDLSGLLEFPGLPAMEDLRVHCHVPLSRDHISGGIRASDWRGPLASAVRAGHSDFEIETYTLPVLPAELAGESLGAALVADTLACVQALGLAA